MLSKKKIIIAIILLVVIGVGYSFFTREDTASDVQVEVVKKGDVAETVSVTGELVPEEYADVSFLSAGTIDAVMVGIGDMVAEGDKIASLDRSVLFSQLKEARLAVDIAVQSEQWYARNRDDYDPEERQSKKLASEQARVRARTIEAQMRENVLTAPMAGTISRFDARIGEVVGPNNVVARVVKPGSYVLESRVPESDISDITVGMKARVTFDALSKRDVFEGEVVAIDAASTVVQDVVSYKVRFRLAGNDERLKEGMTGDIDIETAKRSDVLWVPYRALAKEGDSTYVQVKRGPENFERVEVVTGLEGDEGTVEIMSGLREGDEVTIGAIQKK